MGSCIICGASVDGRICDLHQEDVVFEFRGTRPEELTVGRYYRGTVDGYAEFGVFVDIGDSVTGLLHKSELDRRLDSLDWEPGDTVYVQVKNVRDNGNVDLGWSIRQDESAFRGTLVDDPDADEELLVEETDDGDQSPETEAKTETETETETEQAPPETGAGADAPDSGGTAPEGASTGDATDSSAEAGAGGATMADLSLVAIADLGDHVGERVRVEGEIESARQTSGPTVFDLRDETGSVDCAAFEEAGVRAYPDVGEDDVVRIEGEVERRRGELQVETEALVVLEDEERSAVTERMAAAMDQRARPEAVEPLAGDPAVEAVAEPLQDAATAVRRAVFEGRPIVVRHSASVDGYVAGVALERATLPLIRQQHRNEDAEYHYFDRRPLEGSVYDMNDATGDVTSMLSNRERHDEAIPLFVFVAAAGTAESLDGLELLDVYDAGRVVVEDRVVDDAVAASVDTVVSPSDGQDTSATALAANVAAHVNGDVRGDLGHLPAVSFWDDAPAGYADLAAEAGYDADEVRELREAVALEAYYQSYEDKRELIIDLLFAEHDADATRGLAANVSEQFRTKMETALDTAEANLERRERDGRVVLVLDTDAYVHRYEFPPEELLLDELYRRHREAATALLGVAADEAFVRTDADLDVRTLVERAAEAAPEAALDARGAREGRIEFLSGERAAARDAVVEALDRELSATPEA